MDADGRRAWVESVIASQPGREIRKEKLLGLLMAKELSHSAAYDLINSLLALDVLHQVETSHPPGKILKLVVFGP